jgi:hypothetical protein
MVSASSFWLVITLSATVQAPQQVPVPQPFPRPGGATQPSTPAPAAPREPVPPATPQSKAPAGQPSVDPTEATLGVPIYPGAQFIASYDAGHGQHFYLFGSAAPFVDLVTYYRTVLKQKGELIFEVPATHEFDIGRFNEQTMAFPPSVTVKDFESDASKGYPNPKPGGQPPRFRTIIQIVPVEKP